MMNHRPTLRRRGDDENAESVEKKNGSTGNEGTTVGVTTLMIKRGSDYDKREEL